MISVVTAFLDIGRHTWDNVFRRPIEAYFDSFPKMLPTLSRVVVFMDDRYLDRLPDDPKITVIPINKTWLYEHSLAWKKERVAREIMESEGYRTRLRARIQMGYPENVFPEYNTINHAKIDFIHFAIQNRLVAEDDWVAWLDFGYYGSVLHNNPSEFPHSALDVSKFVPDRVNCCLGQSITPRHFDMDRVLLEAPDIFAGGFYIGPVPRMNDLYFLYHDRLDHMYAHEISDDDQHVLLRCFLARPDLFHLFVFPTWPQALLYFQKDIA